MHRRTLLTTLLLVAILPGRSQDPAAMRTAECASWQNCRQLAEDAAERKDYESFHDLAWRAVQKGPKNDPALMTMLARAQSLSGRPHDALVMLQRLAKLGIATDAATNDDFRRVRSLAGWAELQEALAAIDTNRVATPSTVEQPVERAVGTPERLPESASSSMHPTVPESDLPAAEEALRFATRSFTPAGLAYDAVSDRFIVGNRGERKLTVVDEFSHRVANLAGAQSAGFGEIAALEIDPREGDLWVVTASTDAGDSETTLHKLQLVSARVLYALPLPERFGHARFVDVAVSPRSSVLVLDSVGRRVFRVPPKARTFEVAAKLDASDPSSLAPASDAIVYVAHPEGITRIDLASRSTKALGTAKDIDITALSRIRWHRGSLIGVQKTGDGTCRIVRIRLDASGSRALALDVLDRAVPMLDPTAAAVTGDVLYYLSGAPVSATAAQVETLVRRVALK